MCKNCYDMKIIRQCELDCYCADCLNDLCRCTNWVWEPPQPSQPSLNAVQMDSFLDQLEGMSF